MARPLYDRVRSDPSRLDRSGRAGRRRPGAHRLRDEQVRRRRRLRIARALSPSPFVRPRIQPDQVIRTVVGLRPYRPSGFVVRGERMGEKLVVHNYGHGGGGITLSWGSSALAVREAPGVGERRAAVLGAGIMGLTTARLLQDRGWAVTIYAKVAAAAHDVEHRRRAMVADERLRGEPRDRGVSGAIQGRRAAGASCVPEPRRWRLRRALDRELLSARPAHGAARQLLPARAAGSVSVAGGARLLTSIPSLHRSSTDSYRCSSSRACSCGAS